MRMHPILLRFDDQQLEREFRLAHARDSVATLRLAAVLAIALNVAFAILDTKIVDEGHTGLLVMRMVVFGCLGLGFLLTYHPSFPRIHQLVVCSGGLAIGLGMASMQVIAPVPDSMSAMGMMLTLIFLCSFVRARFVPASLTAGILIVAWETGLLLSDVNGITITHLNFEVLGFLVVSLAVCHTLERLWRETFVRGRQIELNAVSTERKRIERDIHDGAQQQLVNAALMIQLAKNRLNGADEQVTQLLTSGIEKLTSGLAELRDLSRGIFPVALSDFGLVSAVESLAQRSAVPVELQIGDMPRFDEHLEMTAYFVIAEALTNVVKHAGATSVVIAAGIDGKELRVSVADDGVGGADEAGLGLQGLRERVGALGGQLRVTSRAGAGTTLVASFPIAARSESLA